MSGVQGNGEIVELIAAHGCGRIEVGGGSVEGGFDVFSAVVAANDVELRGPGCAVENSSCDGHGSS